MDLKTGFNALALASLTFATVASSAAAGPLERRHVPADCAMLVHVDLEALHDSHIGAFLKEHRHGIEDLEQLEQEIGLDPFEDVLDVTMYALAGGSVEHRDGVVVIATLTEDLEHVISMLEEHADEVGYRVRERNGRAVHSFKAEGDRAYGVIEEVRDGRHRLVVSQDSDALNLALDVISGEVESLRDSGSVLAGFRPRAGAIVYAAVADVDALPINDREIRSRFLAKAEGAYFQLGEDDDETFAMLQVSTHKEEDAILLAQTGQGLVALGALVNSSDDVGEDVRLARARLLNGIRFEAEDNRIRLSLRFDTDDLHDMIEMMDDF